MFDFLKKNKKTEEKNIQQVSFALSGLHCNSCALLIDNTLENIPGVVKSQSNYARQVTTIEFDKTRTTIETLQLAIEETGYGAKLK